MHCQFAMKELGNVSYFWGVSVHTTPSGFFLSQHKYAVEVLQKACMLDCKPYSSLISAKVSFSPEDSAPYPNDALYRSLVGLFSIGL